MGCEHPVRRRGPIHRARILTLSNIHIRITKYVHSHHRTHISTLSNTCFRFNAHAFPHYQIRAFTSPHTHFRLSFCGCIRICKYQKNCAYTYTCNSLWHNNIHKMPTFALQKPYFCTPKTPFLHAKNHTFATQKPPF